MSGMDFGPQSPDFFLWDFLKQRVYSNNPRILEDIKHNTEQAAADTDQQTLQKAAKSTVKKNECLSSRR
jgi:hypothetical protein